MPYLKIISALYSVHICNLKLMFLRVCYYL